MVDSPMYAVINNSMGSGSVTYECEGHETRLSDCMTPPSSIITPCYYALVKCYSGGSTTSGSSAGIVAGVVVLLLVVLLVVTIVIIILIVWLKRRDKNSKPGNNNANSTSPQTLPTADIEKTCLQDNPSYQPTTAFLSGTDLEAGNVTQLQKNPSYQPITVVSARTNMIMLATRQSLVSTHFQASAN